MRNFIMKYKKLICLGGIVCVIGIALPAAILAGRQSTAVNEREEQAVRGTLAVGVTESGNVSIGTVTQSFELDLSAYESASSTETSDTASAFGMPMGTGNTASESRLLEVEEIYVEAGQEVTAQTKLLALAASSVENIRQKLAEDAEGARLYYEQTLTAQKQTNQQAESDLALDSTYGEYAQAEYDKTMYDLARAVEEAADNLTDAQESAADKTAEIAEQEALLATQQEVLKNAEYARDNTDREGALYWWVVAVNTADEAEALVETLEEEIETAKEELLDQNSEIVSCKQQLALANRNLAAGEIEAEETRALRQLHYDNAQDIYDVSVESSAFAMECAKEDYEEAKARLTYFDELIQDNTILSQHEGIITSVGVAEGEGLSEGSAIITLNDYEDATITVDVEEADMASAQPGNPVNIVLTAYPEEVLEGEVLQVGDAQINSTTNQTTYSVTVKMTQSLSGLYEGMSAEVTFITKETQEVLYIPNRAVTRDGTISTVRKKTADGRVEQTQVVTGFSDGIYVEITEGLSEGDTVLIESSVTQ